MARCSFREGRIFMCKLKLGNLAPRVRISLLGKIVPHSLDLFFRIDDDAVGDEGLEDEESSEEVGKLAFSTNKASGCLRFLPLFLGTFGASDLTFCPSSSRNSVLGRL